MSAMREVAGGEPVLRVRELSLAFGGLQALHNISFDLYPDEIVGLIGPNGAGKTALLNCITGFYRPQQGSIDFGQTNVAGLPTGKIANMGISRTFQEAAAMKKFGARDLLLLGRERFFPRGVLRYLTPAVLRPERQGIAWAYTIAEEIGILDQAQANVNLDELPYGVRKLADLGRALACEPKVLLMDEPAAGLSRSEKERMARVIVDTQHRRRNTQVLVDHDLDFVSAVCDRLIVLSAGEKIAEGGVDEVLRMEQVVESYIGTARHGHEE